MRRTIISASAVGLLAFGTAVGQAHASVIFSDLGPGGAFGSSGQVVQGALEFGGKNDPAYAFVAAATGLASEIDVGLQQYSGFVEASLWTAAAGCGTGYFSTDCGGLVPATELGSWAVHAALSGLGSVTGITGVTLDSGSTYYLELSPGTATTSAAWLNNSIGAMADLYECGGVNITLTRCLGDAPYGPAKAGAFDVLGTPTTTVPEPASVVLLGVAIAGFMLIRRRAAADVSQLTLAVPGSTATRAG